MVTDTLVSPQVFADPDYFDVFVAFLRKKEVPCEIGRGIVKLDGVAIETNVIHAKAHWSKVFYSLGLFMQEHGL